MTIPIAVTLDELIVPADRDGRSGADRVAGSLRRELVGVLRWLGIPGRVEVTVETVAHLEPARQHYLSLFVHGHRCRYPPELLDRVWSTLNSRVLGRPDEREFERRGGVRRASQLTKAVCETCRQILGTRPSVLLDDDIVKRCLTRTPAASLDPGWARRTLGAVLDARIAIRDVERVGGLLVELEGRSHQDAAEALIAALRPAELVIAIRRDYLREIASLDDDEEPPLAGLRRRIAQHLGLGLPRFSFVDDPSLPAHGFSFRINDVETLPWIGLAPDGCLVDDEPATLKALDVEARAALNPVTETDNSVVALSRRHEVRGYHMRTWSPLEYLGLCLESNVRRFAACLLDENTVRDRIAALEGPQSATGLIRTRMGPRRVARVMRALLADGISVSNLPAILEGLAEHEDRLPRDRAAEVNRPRDRSPLLIEQELAYIGSVRRRLSRQVAATVVRHPAGNRLPALVLDERLHHAVASYRGAGGPLPPEELEIVNGGVRGALSRWTEPRWPAILTTGELRPHLRAALAHEFPALAVLAYEEMPVDVAFDFVGEVSAESG